MLNLANYSSIGAALKDAIERFADEVCLIEADREREKERLTYHEFNARAISLARATQDAGFAAGDRASIIMTNQSKWLISAFAHFYSGRHPRSARLQTHARRTVATSATLWRKNPDHRVPHLATLSTAPGRSAAFKHSTVLVTEAPPNADLAGANAGRIPRSVAPTFVPRETQGHRCPSSILSGTGGRPKGCNDDPRKLS